MFSILHLVCQAGELKDETLEESSQGQKIGKFRSGIWDRPFNQLPYVVTLDVDSYLVHPMPQVDT